MTRNPRPSEWLAGDSCPLCYEYKQSGPLVRDLLLRLLDPRPGFLARLAQLSSGAKRRKFYFILSPWHNAPVGYFTMIIGAALAQRTSFKVHFLIDDITYPLIEDVVHPWYNRVWECELAAIEEMCAIYRGRFPITRLSRLPVSRDQADQEQVMKTARRAVELDLSHRIGNKIVSYPPPAAYIPTAEKQLVAKGLRLARLWKDKTGDALFAPGGMVSGGLIYTDLAEHFGLRRATFDCGAGTLYLSVDGIAAHQPDNALSYERILAASREERDFAIALSRKIRSKRELQGDEVIEFKFDTTGLDSYDVVLCMSWEGDSAALGLDYLFENARDWIESTIIKLTKVRPGVRIAVRQHPGEREVESHQSAEALDRVKQLQATGTDVAIFDAFSDVSTYELSRRSKVVVVGSTTFGIEAAMLGLPVVVFRNSYYAGTDFVQRPDDREHYFRLILEAVDGAHTPSAEQCDHAHVMYYVVEVCNRDRMGFTPQPKDFLSWLRNNPLESMKSDDFEMIIGAIAGDAPRSLRKHKQLWAEHLTAARAKDAESLIS
jgi:hypothetical protein